jgi:hypothetical protein
MRSSPVGSIGSSTNRELEQFLRRRLQHAWGLGHRRRPERQQLHGQYRDGRDLHDHPGFGHYAGNPESQRLRFELHAEQRQHVIGESGTFNNLTFNLSPDSYLALEGSQNVTFGATTVINVLSGGTGDDTFCSPLINILNIAG